MTGVVTTVFAIGVLPFSDYVSQRFSGNSPASSVTTWSSSDKATLGAGTLPVAQDLSANTPHDSDTVGVRHSKYLSQASLYDRLAFAHEADLIRELANSESIEDRHERESFRRTIFARLATTNPFRAIALLDRFQSRQRNDLMNELVEEWNHLDRDAAKGLMEEHPLLRMDTGLSQLSVKFPDGHPAEPNDQPPPPESVGTKGFFRLNPSYRDFEQDPPANWRRLTEVPGIGYQNELLFAEMAFSWYQKDGIDALKEIGESLSELHGKQRHLASVIERVVHANPFDAIRFTDLLGNSGSSRNLKSVVFREWAKVDPQTAFSEASRLDMSHGTSRFKKSVLDAWASQDPVGVFGECSALFHDLHQTCLDAVLPELVMHRTEEYGSILEQIKNGYQRRRMTSEIVVKWQWSGTKEGVEWFLSQPDESRQDFYLSGLIGELGKRDPWAAFQIAGRQPDPRRRSMESSIVLYLAEIDVDRAQSLLPLLDVEDRFAGYLDVGEVLGRFDALGAFRLGQELPEEKRRLYFEVVVWAWIEDDPFNFVNNIELIPSADLIDEDVLKTLESMIEYGEFSEAQLAVVRNFANLRQVD